MADKITPTAGLYDGTTLDNPAGNLALGNKPKLIDGDYATDFGMATGASHQYESIGLDLGTAQSVGFFKLWDNNSSLHGNLVQGQLSIWGSSDNFTWTQVGGIVPFNNPHLLRVNDNCSVITPFVTNAPYRYWRLYFRAPFAVISNLTPLTFTELEAFTGAPFEATISSDGDIKILSETVTINSGGALKVSETVTKGSDSSVRISEIKTLTSDSTTKVSETKTITSGGSTKVSETKTIASTGTTQVSETKTITSAAEIPVPIPPGLITIQSSAVSVPYVDPYVFIFDNSDVAAAIPTASTTSDGQPAIKLSYQDAQLKHICNHTLATGIYSLTSCPRCLGTGIYYDIQFDPLGQITPVTDEYKLAQDLEKIMLTESNIFHPDYATNLKKYIGEASGRKIAQIVRKDIIDGVTRLMNSQKGVTSSTREQISSIISIEVDADVDPTKLIYKVQVLTSSGEIKGIGGSIPLI